MNALCKWTDIAIGPRPPFQSGFNDAQEMPIESPDDRSTDRADKGFDFGARLGEMAQGLVPIRRAEL